MKGEIRKKWYSHYVLQLGYIVELFSEIFRVMWKMQLNIPTVYTYKMFIA